MTREQKYKTTDTFIYYNANPHNRITEDCVARAVCTALELPYNTVVMEMAEMQCNTGYSLCGTKLIDLYLASKGWVKHKQPRKADNTKYTGKEFCRLFDKKGSNIVAHIGGHHEVCIKWSVDRYKVHDIWDSTRGCIGNYWTQGN